MKMGRYTIKNSYNDYIEFRRDFYAGQLRIVLVVAGATALYSFVAPFVLPMLGLTDKLSIHIEFGAPAIISLIAFVIALYLQFAPSAKKGWIGRHRPELSDIPSTILIVSGYLLTLTAEYTSKVYRGEDNIMVFMIVSLMSIAVLYLPPFAFSTLYLIFATVFVRMMVFLSKDGVNDPLIFNLNFFILVTLSMNFVRYILGLRNYKVRRENDRLREESEKFMQSITHEMRTPLNAVLGKNELIRRETKEEETAKLSNEIASSGKMLLSLINDVLDLAKIQSGKMNIVPAQYRTAVIREEIISIMKSEAEGHGLQFEVDVAENLPTMMYGDDVRLRQVMLNLLSNAIKYTHEGKVKLTMHVDYPDTPEGTAPKTCNLVVVVEDTGIGIKPEDLPKLSEAFVRIDEQTNRKTQGTGLGLSITSSLLQMMGSELKVQSTYGKGSVFYFTVEQGIVDATPIGAYGAITEEQQKREEHQLLPNCKVLIVDDNRVNYTVAKGLLKYNQIVPAYADSGAKCLELLKENHYDLIFLDHMMPDMDGVETLNEIRRQYPAVYMKVPIVALTANDAADAEQTYKRYGFTSFLSKPVNPQRLEDVLKLVAQKET